MHTKLSFVLIFFVLPLALANLEVGFYKSTCPQAEQIVLQVVRERFNVDKSITAALLRMHFHDCFVDGCDASILIDPIRPNLSEKDAGPNQSVRGYELIDEAKRRLEAACPSRVSCADIVALATRDSVALAKGSNYTLPTGRRDGLVSDFSHVALPGPFESVSAVLQIFTNKNLTTIDTVALFGGHSVGVAHCSLFQDRFSGFRKTRKRVSFLDELRMICTRSSDPDPATFLDQGTSFVFDNQFYKQIMLGRGVLQIDHALAFDRSTAGIVSQFASDGLLFRKGFGEAMVKMGNIGVLVGNAGQIRKNCRVFNRA